jgi:hypothetical protein
VRGGYVLAFFPSTATSTRGFKLERWMSPLQLPAFATSAHLCNFDRFFHIDGWL